MRFFRSSIELEDVIEVRVARYLLVSSTLRKIKVGELLVELKVPSMIKLES